MTATHPRRSAHILGPDPVKQPSLLPITHLPGAWNQPAPLGLFPHPLTSCSQAIMSCCRMMSPRLSLLDPHCLQGKKPRGPPATWLHQLQENVQPWGSRCKSSSPAILGCVRASLELGNPHTVWVGASKEDEHPTAPRGNHWLPR